MHAMHALAPCTPRPRSPRARCCCGELESELGLLVSQKAVARRPSPLMPPHRCVEAQLEALARPDYPEDGDGLRTAFAFALRAADSRVAPRWGAAGPGDGRVLGWSPRRTRLVAPGAGFERFAAALNQLPYQLLLRHERSELLAWPAFNEATAECEVVARVWPAPSHELPHGTQPWRDFTFRLRCVEEGPHKGCWMTRHVETPWDTRNYV